jgi:hypothetical protein
MKKSKPNVKLKEDNSNPNLMVVTKCPLKNIIKHKDFQQIINNNVIRVNKITIQVYQFLNLYLIHKYDKKEDFPYIDDKFLKHLIQTITTKKDKRGSTTKDSSKEILTELKTFYETEYITKCITKEDIPDSTKLNQIIAYECIDILTCIENNIKEHFMDYVNKFVNISFNSRGVINTINKNKNLTDEEKKEQKKTFYLELRTIKNDLLKLKDNYESDKKYHQWLNIHRKNIIRKDKFSKDSIVYDIAVNPQDYLKSMYYINKCLEHHNKTAEFPVKLYQVIPQRTNIIPKFITLDTTSIVDLFITKNAYHYLCNITKYQKQLWKDIFRIQRREFRRKNFTFNYMIKTDGVGASILLIKTINKQPIKITPRLQKEVKQKQESLYQYIDKVEITDDMKKKKLITFDFGYDDLFYCLGKTIPSHTIIKNKQDEIIHEIKQDENLTFRYTQNQRRLESRNKKYNKICDKINKETKLGNKTIKEYEAELSKYSSKTVDYNKFIDYCNIKNKINKILYEHYSKELFRKLKLNRYINTQKSESKMIKNFQKKYGTPEECLLVVGDWSKGDNMKGKESIISKKLKKIFTLNKYKIYLIDEYRTSKLCHNCSCECENFIYRESKKPKDIDKKTGKGIIKQVWGLKKCSNPKCGMIHNRDKNACLNMYKIVEEHIKGKERPKEYTRLHSC